MGGRKGLGGGRGESLGFRRGAVSIVESPLCSEALSLAGCGHGKATRLVLWSADAGAGLIGYGCA